MKNVVILILAMAMPSVVLSMQTNTWCRKSGSDALASNPANWSLKHVPNTNEVVRLYSRYSRSMIWDEQAPSMVGGWLQEKGYIAVVTVRTTPKEGGFNSFTIAGDCIIEDGAMTHPTNNDAEDWWLSLDIGGKLIVREGAYLSASGKGYASGKGPSAGMKPGFGASHGGQGAPKQGDYFERPALTYGSILNPVHSGSGGTTKEGFKYSYNGGGAILLRVGENVLIEGFVVANADDRNIEKSNVGGAAGGSINIRAKGDILVRGKISANGGRGWEEGAGGGGGGRIALVSEEKFVYSPNRSTVAYGGCGVSDSPEKGAGSRDIRGSAGTVYSESGQSDESNAGTLIVSDWHHPSIAGTRIPSDIHERSADDELRNVKLVIDGYGYVVASASMSLRALVLSGTGLDMNGNTFITGAVSVSKREDFETPGTYQSNENPHFGSVIFNGGKIVVRPYFKSIF